jgi:hypothetical protein
MDDINALGDVSDSLVEKMREYLGVTGKEVFTEYHEKYGTVNPVFKTEAGFPHPVHFREGMTVRNFMRTLPECKDWTCYQLDNTWALVVFKAIQISNE